MEWGLEEFAPRIRGLARNLLAGAKTPGDLERAVRRLVEEAEHQASFAGDVLPVACTAGCAACCVLNVAVLFPEAVAIVAHLRRFLSPPALRETGDRLEANYWHLSWLEDEDPVVLEDHCPFLDPHGRCRIYSARPLLCRSVTSTDAETCRQALALQHSGITRPVVMNLHLKEVMETAFRETGESLAEAGLDARGISLTVAVRTLLHDPGYAERYLAGAPLPQVDA